MYIVMRRYIKKEFKMPDHVLVTDYCQQEKNGKKMVGNDGKIMTSVCIRGMHSSSCTSIDVPSIFFVLFRSAELYRKHFSYSKGDK